MGNLPPRAASPWSVATDPTRTRGHLCPLHIPGCVPVGSAGAALGLRREGRPVWDLSTAPATGAVDAGAVLSLPQRQVAHGHSAPGQGARYGAQHAGSEDAVPTALHLPFTAPPGCVGPPQGPLPGRQRRALPQVEGDFKNSHEISLHPPSSHGLVPPSSQ